MKHICRNCHFLAKEYREERTGRALTFSLSQKERNHGKLNPGEIIKEHYALKCHMGVWDEGVAGSPAERNEKVNLINRKSSCFFFPYNSSMLFDAARELERRTAEYQQLRKSNFYTRIGLWVASGALVISALIEFLKNI